MSLEKDLTQTKFRNRHQKAFLNILFTYNYLINKVNDVFKDHNITRQQYNVLRILRGSHPNPLTINIIKERMLDKMSDTSRIVERLKVKKLVDRTKSKNDRRAVEVRITDKGLKLLELTDPVVENFDKLLKNLNDDEVEQLSELLDKIRNSTG